MIQSSEDQKLRAMLTFAATTTMSLYMTSGHRFTPEECMETVYDPTEKSSSSSSLAYWPIDWLSLHVLSVGCGGAVARWCQLTRR